MEKVSLSAATEAVQAAARRSIPLRGVLGAAVNHCLLYLNDVGDSIRIVPHGEVEYITCMHKETH